MKIWILLLALLVVGCTVVKEDYNSGNVQMDVGNEAKAFTYDVRLTDNGFDINEADIAAGDTIDLYVSGSQEHYLSFQGDRISDVLEDGDIIPLDFVDKGRYEISDETTKSVLIVNVE